MSRCLNSQIGVHSFGFIEIVLQKCPIRQIQIQVYAKTTQTNKF